MIPDSEIFAVVPTSSRGGIFFCAGEDLAVSVCFNPRTSSIVRVSRDTPAGEYE